MAKLIIDSDHSVAGFVSRHMSIANVRGQFNKIKGTINFEPDDLANSSVEVIIDVKSITTGIKNRDEHLLSPDFLDADKYPEIIFRSTKVEGAGARSVKVSGDLTIHGITRPVTMDVGYSGPVKSPFGGETTFGFASAITINRFDFGVKWDVPMEDGSLIVGKDIQITLDIEADQSNE